MTPPLLPLSPAYVPGSMCGPVTELPLTSTPDDLIAMEAASLGIQIMRNEDRSTPDARRKSEGTDEADDYIADVMRTPSSPCARKRLRDLEAEVQILPVPEPLAKRVKTVSFPDYLHDIIPMPNFDLDSTALNQDIDTEVTNILASLAEPAIRSLAEEQLVEADTTMRIPVPQVNEIELCKPWDLFRSKSTSTSMATEQADFMLRMKHEFCRKCEKWSGASKVERQLPWTAFPSVLGKVKDEVFDDGSLARYMAGLSFEDGINVDSLISYQPMADEEHDDLDYLQPAPILSESPSPILPKVTSAPAAKSLTEPSTGQNVEESASIHGPTISMQQLLQKRKIELETAKRPEDEIPTNNGWPSHKDQNHAEGASIQLQSATGDLQEVGGLSKFLRMHGKPSNEETRRAQARSQLSTAQRKSNLTVETGTCVDNQHTMPPHSTHISIPVPTSAKVDHQMAIVVSSTLITRRELLRSIQSALPTLDLVERTAYSEHTTSCANIRPDSSEADLTITVNTGIILTTLQKLKQKPLPGQKNFSSIYARVSSVALRYARLIVLLSEGRQSSDDDLEPNTSTTTQLDDRDTDAMADLMGVPTPNGTDVQVIYVSGGETQVAAWIVALISRLQQPGNPTRLLSEETMWERLLRHAGLNAFAAQAVLAALKQPERNGGNDDSNGNIGSCGLPAFVRVTAEERLALVGAAVNSGVVLEAVSRVVDGKWSEK